MIDQFQHISASDNTDPFNVSCCPATERIVLSAFRREPTQSIELAHDLGITADSFFNAQHQRIVELVFERFKAQGTVDFGSVMNELNTADPSFFDKLGGYEGFIAEVGSLEFRVYRHSPHFHALKRIEMCRKAILSASRLSESLRDPSVSAGEVISGLMNDLKRVVDSEESVTGGIEHISSLLNSGIEDYEAAKQNGGSIGLHTGIPKFDEITGGLQKGELGLICARPSQGKSALAMCMIENIVFREERPGSVLFFSAEMTGKNVAHRTNSSHGRINTRHMLNGSITKQNMRAVKQTAVAARNTRYWVDSSSHLSAGRICRKAKRFCADESVDLIVIDYLQHLAPDTREEGSNMLLRLQNALDGFKNLAKDLNIPVLVLAQLKRECDGLEAYKMRNNMIKDCGSAEQQADMIMMIGDLAENQLPPGEAVNRDGQIYFKGVPINNTWATLKGVNLTKQRNGATGLLKPLIFYKHHARWEEWDSQKESLAEPTTWAPQNT